MQQIGLVDREAGPHLQAALQPGQRLVSRDGDLWRWDGFRAGAEDAPSAAALRLQQLNRLTRLKRDLDEGAARAEGASQAHAQLQARLADLARADQMARDARRAADTRVAEAGRMAARAEADKSIAVSYTHLDVYKRQIDTLRGRIAELARDGERESGLNRDAGETSARLDWEVEQLVRAHDGHDDRLAEAADVAREASAALTDREQLLSQATEDAARLAARHQSVQRMLADSRAGLAKAEACLLYTSRCV